MIDKTDGTSETTKDYISESVNVKLRYIPREPDLENPRYVSFSYKPQENK